MSHRSQNDLAGKRIGLFSGTFDPIHAGHIAIARAALSAAQLDEVWFIVNRRPRYREYVSLFKDRLAMTSLALRHEPRLRADADPYQLKGQGSTVDTTRYMTKQYPQTTFVQVSGLDAISHLPAWTNSQEILQTISFAIHLRPGSHKDTIAQVLQQLPAGHTLHHTTFTSDYGDVSATSIRAAYRRGDTPISTLLHPLVQAYIADAGLYKSRG